MVDFKYLNSHLPDIKHVLHKIGRHSSRVFSMLDLKHVLHSINLSEKRKQYTSCCASPGSPTYQYNKLSQGLNVSPAYFTSLMNDLLHDLPSNIHEYIDCIMDNVIIFTLDIKTHKKVIKSFMLMLKKYIMLLNRTVQPAPPIADIDENIVEDMNETHPTLFPVRNRRRQAVPVA